MPETPTKTPTEILYDKFNELFGGDDPKEAFSMLLPGQPLDINDFIYDTTGLKPLRVIEAEGRLVDRMIDIAKLTAGTNGKRISSQYMTALSALVANGDRALPPIKNALRLFLNQSVPDGTTLDGKAYVGTLANYYFELYDRYVHLKEKWETEVVEKREALADLGAEGRERFDVWYVGVAEGRLAEIDTAYARIQSVCSVADMEAILEALEPGPSGGAPVEEALSAARDARKPGASGGYYFEAELQPRDWAQSLLSDLHPVDLLQDPAFIAQSIAQKRTGLTALLAQISGITAALPSTSTVATAAADFDRARAQYDVAQGTLQKTFGENWKAGVEIAFAAAAAAAIPGGGAVAEVAEGAAKPTPVAVTQYKNAAAAALAGTSGVLKDADVEVDRLIDMQSSLLQAQGNVQDAAMKMSALAARAQGLEAQQFTLLPSLVQRITAQLSDLDAMTRQLQQAAVTPKTPIVAVRSSEVTTPDALADAKAVLQQLAPADLPFTVFSADAGKNALIHQLFTSCYPAPAEALSETNFAARAATAERLFPDQRDLLAKVRTAFDLGKAKTPDSAVADAEAVFAEAGSDAPLVADFLKGNITNRAEQIAVTERLLGLASVPMQTQKVAASDRYTELKCSFSTSAMKSDSMSATSSSQSSDNGGFWLFGGASSRSDTRSTALASAFDESCEVQIGLKATRVAIDRGWMDPGVFVLTGDMGRTAGNRISYGQLPLTSTGEVDWATAAQKYNDAIFPAFAVGFLIVKDVTITVTMASEKTQTARDIIDHQAASGGGFLFFRHQQSSASHSDTQSASTTMSGNSIRITMPGPQILGWFLQTVDVDNSTPVGTKPQPGRDQGKETIQDYVSALKVFPDKATAKTSGSGSPSRA